MIFHVCDQRGNPIGELTDASVLSATQKEERNGSDVLEIRCAEQLEKNYRILWRDDDVYRRGAWHEHIVTSAETVHDTSGLVCSAKCLSSYDELRYWHLMDLRPSGTTNQILASLLVGTGWTSSGASDGDEVHPTKHFYRKSVLEALSDFEDAYISEQTRECLYVVGSYGVIGRRLGYRSTIGFPVARFEYGHSIRRSSRRLSPDPVCTALYGWGRGEEVGAGYGRKLSFESINGGVAWVGDEEAREVWGRRDGGHAFGDVDFPDVDDKEELMRLTRAELERTKAPRATYTAEVSLIGEGGLVSRLELGEFVDVVDDGFPGGFRESLRIAAATWDLLDPSKSVIELGDTPETLEKTIARQSRALRRIDRRF